MFTWSLERAVVGFLSGAAVFVQGVIDAVSPPNFQPVGDSHPIPGCPDAVECRTHGCAGNCSESMESDILDNFIPGPIVDEPGIGVNDVLWAQEAGLAQQERVRAAARAGVPLSSPAAGAGCGENSPGQVCGHSPVPPCPGRLNLETPWQVEDFTTISWHDGMPYGVSNSWGVVIAHFDSKDAATAVVNAINRK